MSRAVDKPVPPAVGRAQTRLNLLYQAKTHELLACTPDSESLTPEQLSELHDIAWRRAWDELPHHLTADDFHSFTNHRSTNAARQWSTRAANARSTLHIGEGRRADTRGERKARLVRSQIDRARLGGDPLEVIVETVSGLSIARTKWNIEQSGWRPTAGDAVLELCSDLNLRPGQVVVRVLDT